MKAFNRINALLLLGLSTSACATSHDDIMHSVNRKLVNEETTSCMNSGRIACKALADDLSGKSARSRQSDWGEPRDLKAAKAAYVTCCTWGDGECCRSLIEQNLTSSPEEARRFRAYASFFGKDVRSAGEIADEESKILERVEKAEERLSGIREREHADRAADMQALGGAIQQAGQQLQSDIERANSRASTSGSSATPSAPARTSSSPPATKPVAPGKPAPATTPAVGQSPPAQKCLPLHTRGCSKSGAYCCTDQNVGPMSGPGTVDCENDFCCSGTMMPCNVTADCCQTHSPVRMVCGSQGRCCRPKGAPAGTADGSSVCCNGDDSAKHGGDRALSTCL